MNLDDPLDTYRNFNGYYVFIHRVAISIAQEPFVAQRSRSQR